MNDDDGQIRVVLKPKQKKPSSPSGAMPVIPAEQDDTPSVLPLRKKEPEVVPVRPVPAPEDGKELPRLKPEPAEGRKKTAAEQDEDLAEMEALRKIRELERMSPPTRSPYLPGKKSGCFLIVLVGIFITLYLYTTTLEKGVRTISEIKNPDGKLAKILPQNNELFQELIQDEPPAPNPPPAVEKKEEPPPLPQKPPEETALDSLRNLLQKKAPEPEVAALLRSFQNEFMRSEKLHETVVHLLLKTSYAELCRKEYARWVQENPESALSNRLCGMELFRGKHAIPYLERAIAVEPNRKQTYKRLMEEYYFAGFFQKAAAVGSNYLKIFPDDANVWMQRAMIRIDCGDSPETVAGDLKKALAEHGKKLTESQRAAKLLPVLLRAGEFSEAGKLLPLVKKDPALREQWQPLELMRALSTGTPADEDARKPGISVMGDRMLILYEVSNRNFPGLERLAVDGLPVHRDFWWVFAQWYCRSDQWKTDLPQLLKKYENSLFRSAMLRLWSGKLSLAEARDVLERVPPQEKNIMAFLLSIAAERQGNTIAEKVLLHTVGKTLHSGIYSTLFQRYITAPPDTASKKEMDR